MTIIHGNYNDQNIIPILVDATGKPIVVLGAGTSAIGTVEVTSAPVTEVTSKGGDKILGIESVIQGYYTNTNLPAGGSYLMGGQVPVNKYWHITAIGVVYIGTVTGVLLRLLLYNGTNEFIFINQITPLNALWYSSSVNVIMKAGDYIRAYVGGATAGDNVSLYYLGYQMDVS